MVATVAVAAKPRPTPEVAHVEQLPSALRKRQAMILMASPALEGVALTERALLRDHANRLRMVPREQPASMLAREMKRLPALVEVVVGVPSVELGEAARASMQNHSDESSETSGAARAAADYSVQAGRSVGRLGLGGSSHGQFTRRMTR